MKNILFSGLSSLLLPLGAYAGTPSAASYQRTYLSSSISASNDDIHSSTALPRDLIDLSGDQLDIQSAHHIRELVIVDGAVAEADKAVLRRALKPGVEIIELNSFVAGLPQLIRALDGHKNLAAIHIVSHAEAGAILLGNSRVTPETVQKEVHAFAALKDAVRPGGDLLFYGCDLAANKAGEELLDIVSSKTGLDVAASNNLTGNPALQGDWELEVKRGNIESDLAFSEKALADFSGVLVASNGTKDFSIFSDDNPNLTNTDFILSAKDGTGAGHNIDKYGTYAFMTSGTGVTNHYFYLKPDGTNTTAFELTGLVAGEAFGYVTDFTNVRVVGILSNGTTITSSTLTGSANDGETFTFNAGSLTAFSGVKIKGFKLYFDCSNSCNSINDGPYNFEFRNFTIQNAINTPPAPIVTHPNISISGATGTGGAYKIGDTVTALWNNTAGGDNNAGITGVTANFSQFGGGAAVAATNSGGNWTATHTITAGALDTTNRNVSITATNAGANATTADATNATLDNIAPTVTDGRISISGATGTSGAYKIGDTVTATWSNTAGGDNNSDTISSVTVNFSQFGGGGAVAATNSSGTWTATYTIVAGAIDATGRNIAVSATDNAGNSTTTADTTNATVDNIAPILSSITLSGTPAATDLGMAFTASFSESVSNISTDDFTLATTSGTAAGSIASVSATSGSSVNININGISGNGVFKLNLNGSTNIADDAGNSGIASYSSGSTHTVAIPTVATAPTIGTATAGDGQVSVTFTAPGSNGGSAITTYTATANPGGAFGTCAGPAACIATVTGLSNGTAYTFTVTATNAIGTSMASGMSNSATPKGNQTITFNNPGSQNFGTTPTLSATVTSGLTVTFSSSTTGVCTTTNGGALTFVTAGTCTIDADQAGNTVWNAATTATQSFTVNAVVPGAPTIGTATGGDTQATVIFTAPTSMGGAAIVASGYTVTANPGGATGTGSSSPITVTGLTNGVAYTFTVTATNSAGTGAASAASNSVTPIGTQTITFTNPGAQNFGTTPALSATSTSGLTVSFTSSTTGVCTITSGGVLTFIAAGTCTINADQAGNSSFLTATQVSQSFTVNAVAPGAPNVGNATAGDTQASVAFTAPVFTGGANITGYTVTSNPGGLTGTGSASPITVTGLTNGVAYTFTVTATNSVGTGSASIASNSITPAASQTITFTDPGAQNFGTSPALSASASSGLPVSFGSSTSAVCTVDAAGLVSLVDVGACTITVSQAGNGSYSAATSVSHTFNIAAVIPAAPTVGVATAGNGQASVTFIAPGFSGGVSVTGYTVTATPGGATASGTTSPLTVPGLTNGTAYTFTVTATNSVGVGPASAVSNPVTPMATQTISFVDPGTQNLGTSPTFIATASSGLAVSFSSSTPSVCTITSGGGLTFLTSGTCTVDAVQAGNSIYQAAPTITRSFSVEAVVPGAPTIGVVTAADGQATVNFTAPSSSGSSTITGYTVTSSPGGITATGASSPIVVTGLTDGMAYTFTVTAASSAGTSVASAASVSVTPKTSQTINFTNPGAQTMGSPGSLVATASSGLSVFISSSTSTVCMISLGNLVLISSGTCTITAEQAGNTVYAVATSVSHSFTVNPAPNEAPVITQGSLINVTMSEDGAPTAFALQLNATDSNSDTLTWSIVTQPDHGSVSVATTGAVSYIPAENYNGADIFTVGVSDGEYVTNSQVTVTLTAVNDVPIISGVPLTSLNQDVAYSFVPVVTDVDVESSFTYSITNKPTWASFNTATGALTGTPSAANVGTVSNIVVNVSDGTATVSLPAFSIQVNSTTDPLLPVLTVPANLEINATALYTPVTLRRLLQLSNSSTQTELDVSLDKLATDTNGNSCCITVAAGVTASQPLLLPPGRHEVKWTATNAAGLKTTGVQMLDIRPLVSLSKSQIALRGSNTEFRIILNGPAPSYPVTVSYVLDENTTATTAEHTLTSSTATLASNGQLEVAVPVTLQPGSGLGDSQIVVRLTGDTNIGATNRHTISIREGNVAPVIKLSLTQNSFPTTTITPNGGPVSVVATVTDLNVGDTHTFDWSGTTGLADTDGNLTDATRVFSPASLTGSHQVQVSVTDSAGAQVQAQLNFRVLLNLPVLSADVDTDKDGIDDDLEGIGDSDGNGIPDYLDNMTSSNILPQQIATTNRYLIECDPGVRCGLGLAAMAGTTGGVQILDSEIGSSGDLKVDSSFIPVGGIFDFAISDLPTAGQSINIAIPQIAPIPANAVYRKFQKGQWMNFVENADNVLRSALGNPGYCPPPGSGEWVSGLVEGNYCVQLTISDGGPNDADGIVNSTVVDPGAVSVAVTVTPPVEPPVNPPELPPVEIKTKGGGGAVDYTLLLLVGGLLLTRGLMHRRSKLLALGTLLLVSVSSQANDFSDHLYLRVDVYKISGSKNQEDFNSQLVRDGYSFSLTEYDVSRTGSQLSLGYKWNDNVYTELGYLDLGDVKVNLWLDGSEDQTAFGRSFAKLYPTTASGVTLVQGLRLTFNEQWSVSPEVGIFIWKKEVDVNGGKFRVGDKSNEDLLVGARLDYQVTDYFGLGLGVRSLLFNADTVNLWGVSTRWDF
jgi:hypothetical protein